MVTETRYFRGDKTTVNGLNAWILGSSSGPYDEHIYYASAPSNLPYGWCFDVYRRQSNGSQTLIGSEVAEIEIWTQDTISGVASQSWQCPETSLNSTDSIRVDILYSYGYGYDYYSDSSWQTPQLGAVKLNQSYWVFNIEIYSMMAAGAFITFGTSSTCITNISYETNVTPTVDSLTLNLTGASVKGTKTLLTGKQYYDFILKVSDADGVTDIDFVNLSLDVGSKDIVVRAHRGTGDSWFFTTVTDPSNFISLNSSTSSHSTSGTQKTFTFKIMINWNWSNQAETVTCRGVVTDSKSAQAYKDYSNVFGVENRLEAVNLALDDYRCNPSQTVYASGYLYYNGTVIPPPNDTYTVTIRLNTSVRVTAYPMLLSGAFSSIPFNVESTVGSYTYNVLATYTSTSYNFNTLIVDKVKVDSYSVADNRVNVNSNVNVDATLRYEYDNSQVTNGSVTINTYPATHQGNGVWRITRTSGSVTAITYNTVVASGNTHGISTVNQNGKSVSVIWDRVKVLSYQASSVFLPSGSNVNLDCSLQYEYDNANVTDGTVTINAHNTSHQGNGVWRSSLSLQGTHTFNLVAASGNTHGITSVNQNSKSVTIVWYYPASLTDTLNSSDSVSKKPLSLLYRTLYVTDSKSFKSNKVTKDSGKVTDSFMKLPNKVNVNVLGCNDKVSKKSLSFLYDLFTVNDKLLFRNNKVITTLLKSTDVIGKLGTRFVSSSAGLYDVLCKKSHNIIVKGILGNNDSISKCDTKLINDSFSLSNSVSCKVNKVIKKTLSVTNSVIKKVSKFIFDSVNTSDSVSNGLTLLVNEVRNFADSVYDGLTVVVQLSSNYGIDATSKLNAIHSLNAVHSLTSFVSKITKTPNVNKNENLMFIHTTIKKFNRGFKESLQLTGLMSKAASFKRSYSESVSFTDVYNKLHSGFLKLVESYSVTSLFTSLTAFKRNLAITLTTQNVFSRVTVFNRSYSETMSITDVYNRVFNKLLSCIETISHSKTFNTLTAFKRNLAVSLTLQGVMSKVVSFTRSYVETLTVTDTYKRIHNSFLKFTRFISLSETFESLVAFNRNFDVTLETLDSIGKTVTVPLTSIIETLDEFFTNQVVTFTEQLDVATSVFHDWSKVIHNKASTLKISVTLDNIVSVIVKKLPTVNFNDSTNKISIKFLTYVLSVNDAIKTVSSFFRSISETLTLTIKTSKQYIIIRNSVLSFADVWSSIQFKFQLLTEILAIDVTVSKLVSTLKEESFHTINQVSKYTNKFVTGTTKFTDKVYSTTIHFLKELVTVNDNILKLTDKLFSETLKLELALTYRLHIVKFSTVKFTDKISNAYRYFFNELLSVNDIVLNRIGKFFKETVKPEFTTFYNLYVVRYSPTNIINSNDSLKKAVNKVSYETLQLQDFITYHVNFFRTFSETLKLIDKPVKQVTKSLQHNLHVLSNILTSTLFNRTFNETIQYVTIVTKQVNRVVKENFVITSIINFYNKFNLKEHLTAISNKFNVGSESDINESITVTVSRFIYIPLLFEEIAKVSTTIKFYVETVRLELLDISIVTSKSLYRQFNELTKFIVSITKTPVKHVKELMSFIEKVETLWKQVFFVKLNETVAITMFTTKYFTKAIQETIVMLPKFLYLSPTYYAYLLIKKWYVNLPYSKHNKAVLSVKQ